MAKYTSEDVRKLAEWLKAARDRDCPAHFLTGAGCSISAGIPGAADLIKRIHKDYPTHCADLKPHERSSYGACMAILPKKARRHLIKPYLDDAKINWGTIALAQLISSNFVSRVLTVNFDLVLENACGLLGLQPAVYDFGVAPANDLTMLVSPAIIHLHGQSYGLALLNTEEETRKHREKLQPIIRDTLLNAPLVVVGYSGSADGIFQTLLDEFESQDRLYWASYQTEPQAHIAPFLAKEHFHFIGGTDFDRFMIELAQSLGCWPPDLFLDPLAHMLEELSPVVSYPIVDSESAIDIVSNLRTKLKSWQKRLDEEEDLVSKLQTLYMKGQFEQAAQTFESVRDGHSASKEENDIAGWSFLGWANLLSREAEKNGGDEARKITNLAAEKYRRALELQPGKFEILYNWGTLLLQSVQRSPENDVSTLLIEAAEKLQEASRIKPSDSEALCNWGSVLFERAKRSEGEAAIGLFEQAAEKYSAAHNIGPKDHGLLYNWGFLLSELAERVTGAEVALQVTAAIDKYREALAVKPGDQETLFYLTRMLFKGAKCAQSEHSKLLNAEAREKMRALKVGAMGPYNLACLAALDVNEELCRKYLQMAEAGGTLPLSGYLAADADLAAIRNTQWFQQMLERKLASEKS